MRIETEKRRIESIENERFDDDDDDADEKEEWERNPKGREEMRKKIKKQTDNKQKKKPFCMISLIFQASL